MLPFCSPKLDERLLRVLDTLNVKLHPRLRTRTILEPISATNLSVV
jgi:hypothetical protein